MLTYLRPAVILIAFFTLLTGIAYPFTMTGLAQGMFFVQANGSMVESNGVVIGSSLIGQSFVGDGYFHGRPSAVGYDASNSSGSNYGPSSTALHGQVKERAAAYGASNVPADLLTASGSGLDPDLSPGGALAQTARVAAARGLPEAQVRDLVAAHTLGRDLGVLGELRVNVLALNMALDDMAY